MNSPLITKIFAVLTVLYGCGGGSSLDSASTSDPVLTPSTVNLNNTTALSYSHRERASFLRVIAKFPWRMG